MDDKIVKLRVKIEDKVKEKFPNKKDAIEKAEKDGVSVTLTEIVNYGTRHFDGTPAIDNIEDPEKREEKAKAYVWNHMETFLPHVQTHEPSDSNRIVLTEGDNGDVRKNVSELMAVGTGICLCEKVLGIDYSTVTKIQLTDKDNYNDFRAICEDEEIKIETRGRYKKRGRTTAIEKAREKAEKATKDDATSIACIYYPTDSLRSRTPDLELVDPPAEYLFDKEEVSWRLRLMHYSEFISIQGHNELGGLLKYSAQNMSAEFIYLLLRGDYRHRLSYYAQRYYRTSFNYNNIRYLGTVYGGINLPKWLAPVFKKKKGFVFWGISEQILHHVLDFHLEFLDEKYLSETKLDTGVIYSTFSDGTIMIWFEDKGKVMNHV